MSARLQPIRLILHTCRQRFRARQIAADPPATKHGDPYALTVAAPFGADLIAGIGQGSHDCTPHAAMKLARSKLGLSCAKLAAKSIATSLNDRAAAAASGLRFSVTLAANCERNTDLAINS